MVNFSDTTLCVLREAGWYPGRSVSTGTFEAYIASEGYYANDTIRDFLREFGGLTLVPPPFKSRNGERIINPDPLIIGTLYSGILPWSEEVSHGEDILHGETLIPIGYQNPAQIFMSYSGQIYAENVYKYYMLTGTPCEVIDKICSNTFIDKNGSKLHKRIATVEDDKIEFFEDVQLSENLKYILERSITSLIPFNATASNNTRRLYGLEMKLECKTYAFDESAERIVNFLYDLVLLYPDWLPFYITSTKSSKHRSNPHGTIPSLQEMKEIMVDTSWHQSSGSHITCCNIGLNHNNIGQMLEVCFQVCAEKDRNESWVRFPPCYDTTNLVTSKEFIINIFNLFLKHWQPRKVILFPSPSLTKRCIDNMTLEDVGWFSYFFNGYGSLPKLPDWAKVISLSDHGNYIQVTDELPNYKNDAEFTDFAKKLLELSDIIGPWLRPQMYPPV
ncbi:MAG: SUKH-3 domain-containing protein [Planctomycetaceae bacterium]|jgi:hypothetical protein|nr:SUKH-3 domain-containing protein [Planctomycetaceae bacterium]